MATIALVACGVDLPLPEASRIVCTSDAQCPKTLVCQLSARRCVNPGDEDVDVPRLINASATDLTHVALQLTEELDPASIARATVAISPSLAVRELVLNESLRDVLIEVEPQQPGLDYTIAIARVTDLAGNAIADDAAGAFTGFGAYPDREPPVIIAPAPDAIFSPGSITLSWSSRSLASSYSVDVAMDAAFSLPVPGSPFTVAAPATTLTLTAVEARRYYWRVEANTTKAAQVDVNTFDVLGDTLHVACASGAACSDEGASGNISAPMQTLSGALTRAAQRGVERILIATRGEDVYAGNLVLAGTLTLLGGYDASFDDATRDGAARPTLIAAESGATLTILGSSRVRLDGLTVRSMAGNAIDIDGNLTGDVQVARCVIEAGDVGVDVRNSDTTVPRVLLEGNTLRGIAGAGRMYGVVLDHAGARLVRNTMTFLGRGIGAELSTAVMEHNELRIDLARESNAFAGYFFASKVDLRGNFFSAPSFGADSVGIAILGIASAPTPCTVVNNVIVANEGNSFSRNYISCSGDHATVTNNLFVTGVAPRSIALQSQSSSEQSIFVDNIFLTLAGARRSCFMQHRTATLTDLRNNAFVGCTELYVNDDDTLTLATIGAVNDPSSLGIAGPPRAAANVALSESALALANPPMDFHLTAMTASIVRSTGVDTSLNTCGSASNASCGAVSTDKDGATRTCPSAGQCFSMGPYESP